MSNIALKWLRSRKKSTFSALVCVLFFVVACQHEQSIIGTPLDSPSTTEGVFQVSYDTETMTQTLLEDANIKPTALENVGMMPKIKKSAIRLTVFDDGTSDWTIKDMKPANPIVYADQSPPRKRPKTVLTRIDRSGMASFYDKDNRQKHQYQMTMPSMKNFVAMIAGDTSSANKMQVINSVLNARGHVDINVVLEAAQRNGAEVKSISKNVISVTMGGKALNSINTRDNTKIVENVIDTTQRILLGTTVKNQQGQVVSNVYMKYDMTTPQPTLEMMEQRVYNLNSPANRRVVTISNTAFSNQKLIIH
jgi:hypothetical protein